MEPRPLHFGHVAGSPIWSSETEAEFDASSIPQMKQARVPDGLASFAMNDGPLAKAEALLLPR